jgi:hypothetical protein
VALGSSSIARQLSLSPMRLLAQRVKCPNNVTVGRPKDTHFREQHWPAVLSGIDEHLNGKAPLWAVVL